MKRVLWLALVFAGADSVEAQVGRYSSVGIGGNGRLAAPAADDHSSVAIGTDGLALISYYDGTSDRLVVAHCSNLACTSANLSVLDTGGGGYTSVAIGADGRGLISYLAGADVKVAHCADPACTSASTSLVHAGEATSPAQGTALAIGADGLGLIVFPRRPEGQGPQLMAAHCTDLACSSSTPALIASSPSPFTGYVSPGVVAIGPDGLPLIGYSVYQEFQPDPNILYAKHCASAACDGSVSPSPIVPATPPLGLAMGSDGRGLLAFSDRGSGLRMAHCANAGCTSASLSILDAGMQVSDAAVATGADGLGLVAYVRDEDLKVAHCSDLACTSATVTVLDRAGRFSQNGLAIGADGLGLISYRDARGHLKVAHCESLACTSATLTVLRPPTNDDTVPPVLDAYRYFN